MARTVDGEHVVAAAREKPAEQEIDASVSAAAGLEHDGPARVPAAVEVQVDPQPESVDPDILDSPQHPLSFRGTPDDRAQARAAEHHVAYRGREPLLQRRS